MAEIYDVAVKVVSQKGHCEHGHKVGDEWIVNGGKTPAGICIGAFIAFATDIRILRHGGAYPWSSDSDATQIACPDSKNPVVFEVRRLRG